MEKNIFETYNLQDKKNLFGINNHPFMIDALKDLLKEFNEEKKYHWYSIAIILRNIYEFEKMLSHQKDIKKTIWHTLLHPGGIKTDWNTYISTLLELFRKLPEEYKIITKEVEKKFSNLKIKKTDLFKLNDTKKNSSKKINKTLKIKSFNFFCFFKGKAYYIFWGKDNKEKVYSFLSKNYLKINSIYDFEMRSYEYKYKEKNKLIWVEEKYINILDQRKNEILIENNIENEAKLIELATQELINYNKDSNVDNLNYLINYYNDDFDWVEHKTNNLFFPFYRNPFLNNTPGKKIPKKINEILILKSGYENKNNIEVLKLESQIYNDFLTKETFFIKNYKTNLEQLDNYKFCLDLDKNIVFDKNNKELVESFVEISKQTTPINNDLFFDIMKDAIKYDDKKIIEKVINKVKDEKISVLIGPAGSGKTVAIQELIIKYKNNNKKILILCPTNKALSLYSDITTSNELKTTYWLNNENNEDLKNIFKDLDLLIIDEISMVSDWDFFKKKELFLNTKILIAGDDKQLPPIENKFRVYKWFIDSIDKKNLINLNENKDLKNYRLSDFTDKRIATIMELLRNQKFKWTSENKYQIYALNSPNQIFDMLEKLVKDNYKIITPSNSGFFGTQFINRFFSNKSTDDFQVGDEIIFDETDHNRSEKKYFKNEFGIIQKIDGNKYTIYQQKKKKNILIEKNLEDLPFSHSKAITAHKSQGSSFEKIVILITGSEVTYEWLYTSYSRVKNDAIIIITNYHNEIKKWKNSNKKEV